ncbi:hypothetical protein [uncultured Campylobacter sp.]|uniref:hypothetical protein n=1 Tax=uncultured Campylobacter sp. TaxID=218934 RepID=UPI0026316C8C|nr:hypothetical protein [uncultured Campylobacter sp.]
MLLSTALFAVDNNQTVAPSNGAYKAKYDAIFDDLSKPRVGLSDEQIASLQDPFYPKEANVPREANQQVDLGYQLVGIMGDKVKLNDKWYGLGEYVGSYKIVQITGNSVIITNDDENKVELTLKQGSQNVIITYK